MERRDALSWTTAVTSMVAGFFALGVGHDAIAATPQISGSPAHMVLQNTWYVFRPVATDADRDTLTFSIRRKPDWAAFNPSTGRLSGTPRPADVGTYPNIRISVSDSRTTASLPTFGITVTQSASGSVTLSWLPPRTNDDGSNLTNLAGYRIYLGQGAGALNRVIVLNNAGLTRFVVHDLSPARWYFAITSVNNRGIESLRSPTLSTVVG